MNQSNRMQMEKGGEGKSVLNQNFWNRTHLRDTPHWLLWLLHMTPVVYNTQKASQLLFEFSLLISLEKFCMNLTGLESLELLQPLTALFRGTGWSIRDKRRLGEESPRVDAAPEMFTTMTCHLWITLYMKWSQILNNFMCYQSCQ